jgi:ankyrin repeat protein
MSTSTEELFLIVDNGDIAALEESLASGADAAAMLDNGETLLHRAALKANAELVDCLLRHGAPVDAQSTNQLLPTALFYPVVTSNVALATRLLDAGASVSTQNERLQTPLHIAVTMWWQNETLENKVAMVKLLLDHGADPNATDQNGVNPYEEALIAQLPELAEMLRMHGGIADPGGPAGQAMRGVPRHPVNPLL